MSQSKNVVHLRGSRDAFFVGFKIDGKRRALTGVTGCVLALDPELEESVVHLRGTRDAFSTGFRIDGKRRALAGVTGCIIRRFQNQWETPRSEERRIGKGCSYQGSP